MAVTQLIYVSSPFGFDDQTLAGILLDARRRNLRDNITGALIARRDLYLQLLEGPKSAVEAAYHRIRVDDRHADIRAVHSRRVEHRLFARWAMRDDPVRSWMWSREAVAAGAPEAASADEIIGMFERLRLSLPV